MGEPPRNQPPILDYAGPPQEDAAHWLYRMFTMSTRVATFWVVYAGVCVFGAIAAADMDSASPQLMGPNSWKDGYELVVGCNVLLTPALLILRLIIGEKRINPVLSLSVALLPVSILLVRYISRH